jgi:aerobic-type carbon monoxide dehydrogenase small subunit (CoxS/CutS family)
MAEQKEENVSKISRREFLKDAGLVVGGATIGSMAVMAACNGGATATVTETKTSTATTTKTVTSGGSGTTVTVTSPPVTSVVETAVPTINITVNGNKYELKVEPYESLRVTLREKVGLTSIKDMCVGYGACGTCTAIVNGRPILTCMALSCECDGAVIETAEGVAMTNPKLVDAYIYNYCMQCGYCTPGFIVTSKALLDKIPNPTEDDIREALAGNLCRCATYQQHVLAVKQAAAA